uniref:tetratricopeptide repeat protein 25 isoform X2 n=1 Tax=Ciona intestinalis TaxID=7719 RepID=UPI000180BB78|nr:tetratricopeptide repeat protein 25 isoform X2 [Ciona intestinalis]|eukprot:XP_002129888.1 tetratricopeptide repeat protein 25 isoform X2 [Ciona intestinalis]
MYDDEDGEDGPKSSFTTYLAEGDKLYNAGEYQKALESYTTALEIEAKSETGLVARSKCYLQIGDAQAALQDAEASLSDNKEFHKGLYQKAEALYQMGDFEYALVFYHRGHKLRPELQEFRLGIQKAQEAIDNCVGSPSSVKLENKGDLSFFNKMDEGKGKAKQRGQYRPPQKPAAMKTNRALGKTRGGTSSRTAKALLGELYADKEYLEKLLKDDDLVKGSSGGMSIYDLVTSGINYLDTRTEFWRQQKPMYARKRDRLMMQQKWSNRKTDRISDPTTFILKNLEEIDSYLADGKGADSLSLAVATLRTVNRLSDSEIPNKPDVVANLHSCIGNAHLELGQTDEALDHHQKDLEISEKHNFQDARSRALDNLGRVYARVGKFQKAIDCWQEKLPLSKSAVERTWLFHEIGRCHLELGESEKARDFGLKSLQEAKEAEDDVWQLNAGVLTAQAEVKLGEYEKALESFQQSLETAKLQGDDGAEGAITKAIEDVKNKIEKQKESEQTSEAEPLKEEEETEREEQQEEENKE